MTAQLIADLKFCPGWLVGAKPPGPKHQPADWWTWAHVGPGSSRGMMRVLERDTISVNMSQIEFTEHLAKLQGEIDKMAAKAKMPLISGQDLQNCLCEFDKYERVRLGQGDARSHYQGV